MPLVHDPNALSLADVVGYTQHIGIGAAARFVYTLDEPVDAKYDIDFYSALLHDQADAEAVAGSIDWEGKIFAAADQEEAKKVALEYHQEKLGGQFAMQLRNPDTKEHYLVGVTQEGWWAQFVLFLALAAAYPHSPNDNAQ